MRWTLCIAFALLLSACDSGASDTGETFGYPAPLVGAWSPVAKERTLLVRYPRDQTVIQLTEPPTVTVRLGERELPLSTEAEISEAPSFFDLEASAESAGGPGWQLQVDVGSLGLTVVLVTQEGGRYARYTSRVLPVSRFSRFLEGFSIAPIEVTHQMETTSLSVEGRFPTVEVPANIPTIVRRSRRSEQSATEGWQPDIWQFTADGTIRSFLWLDAARGYSGAILGQWDASASTFRRTGGGTSVPRRADYELRGDTLRLTVPENVCFGASCPLTSIHSVDPDVPLEGYEALLTRVLAPTEPPD